MKDEKIKALFMAQYYEQHVFCSWFGKVINLTGQIIHNTFLFNYRKDSYLLLRSIEQLTDGEKFMITQALQSLSKYLHFKYTKKRASFEYSQRAPILENSILKALGILVEFTFLNDTYSATTLTPDQIIERGWAKLRTV